MKPYNFLFIALLFTGCQLKTAPQNIEITIPNLNLAEANRLLNLPLHCVNTEYPNKLNQTIGSAEDLQSPKTLHPVFYGCFDWHSCCSWLLEYGFVIKAIS